MPVCNTCMRSVNGCECHPASARPHTHTKALSSPGGGGAQMTSSINALAVSNCTSLSLSAGTRRVGVATSRWMTSGPSRGCRTQIMTASSETEYVKPGEISVIFGFLCTQTSLIRASLIPVPHNPNTVPGNLVYHFLFTMVQ